MDIPEENHCDTYEQQSDTTYGRETMNQMKTNEENRIEADRRIPLNIFDMFFEILGNMNWNIFVLNTDEEKSIIETYVNDNGFSEADQLAIHGKNESGNNTNTTGLNGMGIKLTLDNLLPENKKATAYSIDNHTKCYIGHFKACLLYTSPSPRD